MAQRTIKRDAQGLFIVNSGRTFRYNRSGYPWQAPNLTNTNGTCYAPGVAIRVRKGRNDNEIAVHPTSSPWNRVEVWETKQPPPPPKPKKELETQDEFRMTVKGASLLVIVSDNGKVKTSKSRTVPADIYLALNAGGMFTFAEWDLFVAKVQQLREELPVQRIRTKLLAEMALEEEMDEIRDKYRADDDA